MSGGKKASKKSTKKGSSKEPANSSSSQYSPSYSSKSNYAARTAKLKKAENKKIRKGSLEDRVTNSGANSLDAIVETLVKQGMTREDARKIASKLDSTQYGRKDYGFSMVDLQTYFKRLNKVPGNLGDYIRVTWYLALALADSTNPEYDDPYKSVDKGAKVIYLTGLWTVPRDPRPFAEAMGEEIAFVTTTDRGEIYKLLSHAVRKHGHVKVVGFSDGGKTIELLDKEYGHQPILKAVSFFSVAYNPWKSQFLNVKHVIGDDMLAILDERYTWHEPDCKSKPDFYLPRVNHTDFVMSYTANKKLADIVRAAPLPNAYNIARPEPAPVDFGVLELLDRYQPMRKAA